MSRVEKTRLRNLAEELEIPTKQISDVEFDLKRPSEEKLKGLLQHFHEAFRGEEIIFGGTTAQRMLLGDRKLRHPSNNLDYAVSMRGIRSFHEEFHDLVEICYDPRDFLFMNHDGMRVQCFYDNIFGWYGGRKFKEDAIPVPVDSTEISVAAPEYTIMLKFRKAEERRQAMDTTDLNERQLMKLLPGKDRNDIYTLLLAQYSKNTTREARAGVGRIAERTAELCLENVTADTQTMGNWLRALYLDRSSLNAGEQMIVTTDLGHILTDKFSTVYGKYYFS